MEQPLGMLESINEGRRVPLFRVAGVQWLGTPYWWCFPLLMIAAMLPLVQVQFSHKSWRARLAIAVGYGLLLSLTNLLHSLGHMLSAWSVQAPMQANLISATRFVNLYEDAAPAEALPRRVHVGRSLGGPLLNLMLALLLAPWGRRGGHYLRHFLCCNLLFGLGALLPLRSLDGAVLLRELRRQD